MYARVLVCEMETFLCSTICVQLPFALECLTDFVWNASVAAACHTPLIATCLFSVFELVLFLLSQSLIKGVTYRSSHLNEFL